MIMGVGMKELIRIVGRRCAEEGRIAEEIWELTWGICREIILYLSRRAKKCEDVLEEELQFMRDNYQKEFDRTLQERDQLLEKVKQLEYDNVSKVREAEKWRKRKEQM